MGAIADLWKSERGFVAVMLIVGCTVLVSLGKLTGNDWIDFAKWVAVIYIPAKTVTSAIETYTRRTAVSNPAPNPTPAPGPILVPPPT